MREPSEDREGAPAGDLYDWYRRGTELLERGDAGPAAQLLARARAEEPGSASIQEALARALYDSGRYAEAAEGFRALVRLRPDDDYGRFGLGLSLTRLDRFEEAVEQLSMAVAMRPGRQDYARALRQARATLQARADAGDR
jgi:predicted Zn-dependent protease